MHRLEEIAQSIIDCPLHDIASILPNECGWADALADLSARLIFLPPSGQRARDYVHRRLGSIAVNPNNLDSTKCLTRCYAYRANTGFDDKVVNHSPENAERFLWALIGKAHREREFVQEVDLFDRTERRMAAAGESVFAIHGARGSGKTFFLNHLFASFADILDAQRVIWIRVNLVEDFGADLMHWIYAQSAKVTMRYYDSESRVERRRIPPIEVPVASAVRKYIDESEPDPLRNDRIHDTFKEMQRVFYHKKQEPPLSPQLVPKSIAAHIFEIAQTLGYSFIVALDGLDVLEATPHHQRKFESLVRQLGSLASSPSSVGMVLVAVMRTRSLEALASIGPKAYQPLVRTSKQIVPIDFRAILEKRTGFLASHVPEIARRFSDAEEARLENWGEHFEQFVSYLWERSGNVKLLEMFGDNRRAQTQVAQLTYFEFLQKERQRAYLLIESLVKAGRAYPPRPYEYVRNDKGNLQRANGSELVFDTHFSPSVFCFPFVAYRKVGGACTEVPCREGLMLGVRILQLVHAHSRVIQGRPDVEPLTMAELLRMCNVLFGYPEELVQCLTEEYHEFEFVEMRPPALPSTHAGRLTIHEMPKLQYLLRHFLGDIAYLNLAVMRVPLSLHALAKRAPFFEASTLDEVSWEEFTSLDFGRKRLARWVAIKIINSCELLRLLMAINNDQLARFEGRERLDDRLERTVRQALTARGDQVPGMFKLTSWMRDKVLAEIGRVGQTFEYPEEVKRYITVHCAHWLSVGGVPDGRRGQAGYLE